LDHEIFNYTMKDGIVVISGIGKGGNIVACPWSVPENWNDVILGLDDRTLIRKRRTQSKVKCPLSSHLWYSSMTNDPTVVSNCTWV